MFGAKQRLLAKAVEKPLALDLNPKPAGDIPEENSMTSNLIILYGPSAGSKFTIENKVASSMIDAIENNMDPRTLSVEIPRIFDIMKDADPNF